MNISIKELNSYESIKTLVRDFNSHYYTERDNIAILDELSYKYYKNAHITVAYYNDIPAGYIAYYRNDDKTKIAYISMLVIAREYRNNGVGHKLIDYVINDCLINNYRFIRLEVNKNNSNAIKFYSSIGFVKVDNASSDSIFMSKFLD